MPTGPSQAVILGAVSGAHYLLVQGRLESEQPIRIQEATIEITGCVKADLYASRISVEGSLTGDLFGGEQVIIRHTARVEGNITAPSVILEAGAGS